jgi:hypothetical protein
MVHECKYHFIMEVIRDDMWNKCLTDTMKMYRVSEPDDKCLHLANATWKMKMSYTRFKMKKESKGLIQIEKNPEIVSERRSNIQKSCAATTMAGKPCGFKASCGNFCKKHNPKPLKLGAKVIVKKIKIDE